jgi:hypothetical protein
MSHEEEPQNPQQKTDEPISLAELSRQYLHGAVAVEEYLAMERQLTPRFGETPVASVAILEEIKSSTKVPLNQQQALPESKDSESVAAEEGEENKD